MKITKKQQNQIIQILSIVLAVAVLIGCVSLVVNLTEKSNDDYKTFKPSYSIGAIDSVTGQYTEDKCALYTPELIECTGIELYADFESNIDYVVYYYDENDAYISSTPNEALNLKVDEMPENAVGVRIAIYPNADENEKIGLFEKATYANQLDVKIRTVEVEESGSEE